MSKRPVRKPKKRGGIVVRIAQLPHALGLALPQYQSAGAAGFDLVAAVPAGKPIRLKARSHVLVPTGLVFELSEGYEAQVRPRSGLALKHGVTVLNSPGTIDWDYRGEVGVILVNHSSKAFVIERGERIAQVVIASATQANLVAVEVKTFQPTTRGAGGFGSTGTKTVTRARRPGRPSAKVRGGRVPPKRGGRKDARRATR